MTNDYLNPSSSPRGSRWARILFWVFVGLALLFVIAYFGIGAYIASEVTKIDEHDQFPDSYPGVPYEEVSFPTREDELQITGWYLPNQDSDRAMILVHGRNASIQDAISGTFPQLATEIHKAGFAVLMINLRGHGGETEGQSEGTRYSFGVFDRRDVLGGVDFLINKGFQTGRIGALGLSLGGAATIGAVSEEEAIGILVVESTFADLNWLIPEKFEEETGLPIWFYTGVNLMNQLLYGYELSKVKPIEEIQLVGNRPVMIIHCTTDEDVPMKHPDALVEALPSPELWIVEGGCEHAEIYRDYPKQYAELVIGFMDEKLR